jgi:hypothetical protein
VADGAVGGYRRKRCCRAPLMQLVFLAAAITVLAHHVLSRRPARSTTDQSRNTHDNPARPRAMTTQC